MEESGSLECNKNQAVVRVDNLRQKKRKRRVTSNITSTSSSDQIMFDIGQRRKIVISDFKGTTYVNIREYYVEKISGEEKPGQRGIALTIEQWDELANMVDDVNNALQNKGL